MNNKTEINVKQDKYLEIIIKKSSEIINMLTKIGKSNPDKANSYATTSASIILAPIWNYLDDSQEAKDKFFIYISDKMNRINHMQENGNDAISKDDDL